MLSIDNESSDFNVLDERSNIITVDAVDLKTEDELHFIAQMDASEVCYMKYF